VNVDISALANENEVMVGNGDISGALRRGIFSAVTTANGQFFSRLCFIFLNATNPEGTIPGAFYSIKLLAFSEVFFVVASIY